MINKNDFLNNFSAMRSDALAGIYFNEFPEMLKDKIRGQAEIITRPWQ